jgi:hypothetical protein
VRRADHSSRGVLPSWGVSECDREASIMRRPWLTRGCCTMGEEEGRYIYIYIYIYMVEHIKK